MKAQRRIFLKLVAAGVTGLTVGRARRAWAAWPTSGTMDINPSISNTLVVACKDQAMVKSTPSSMTFATQTEAVDGTRVAANLDAMAMRLANTATPDEAWKTIFRSSKPWAATLVAIKVNVTEVKNMPRLAVVEKLCRVMAGLGVPPANIIVYDGGLAAYAKATSNYTPYFSATDSAKIPGVVSNLNDALGGTTSAPLPDGSSADCTADIAKGKVDILINIAINKGHIYYGKASMCMKNHYGTFAPDHAADYLFKINKADALLGGTPPRQQLCIVDSIFANKTFNTSPEAMPYYLVMGTFAPIVDYLAVRKIREDVLKYSHDSAIIDQYLTEFGYTTKEPEWVVVPPGSASPDAGASGTGGASGRGGGSGSPGGASGAAGGGTGGGGRTGPRGSGGSSQATGTGGSKTAGKTSTGGTGSGGSGTKAGGTSGSGGTSNGSGGTQGSGGTATTSNDGSGGGAGSGGSRTSNTPASGGSSGGSSGPQEGPNTGCGCRVASDGGNLGGVSVAVGTLLAAQLGRLMRRRDTLANSGTSKTDEDAE